MNCPHCGMYIPENVDVCLNCKQAITRTDNPGSPKYTVTVTNSTGVAIGDGATVIINPGKEIPIPMIAPAPPANFVLRPAETQAILQALIPTGTQSTEPAQHVAITTALRGAGGFGKTALAQYICSLPQVKDSFPDGILWVTLGQSPNLLDSLKILITVLTGQVPAVEGVENAASLLVSALGERRCLMVIDDVWKAGHLQPFLRGGERCVRLVTTRNRDTVSKAAVKIDVDAMRQDEAIALLGEHIDVGTGQIEPLRRLGDRLGNWALLVKLVNSVLVNSVIENKQPLKDAVAYVEHCLDEFGLPAFDASTEQEREQAISVTVQLSLNQLSKAEQKRYAEFAVFPEDVDVPLSLVSRLWSRPWDGQPGGMSELQAEQLYRKLQNLSLLLNLDLGNRTLRLHDVMGKYLQGLQKDRLAELHGQVVEVYRNVLETPGEWHTGPRDGYFYRWLPYHLEKAGRRNERNQLLNDPEWESYVFACEMEFYGGVDGAPDSQYHCEMPDVEAMVEAAKSYRGDRDSWIFTQGGFNEPF